MFTCVRLLVGWFGLFVNKIVKNDLIVFDFLAVGIQNNNALSPLLLQSVDQTYNLNPYIPGLWTEDHGSKDMYLYEAGETEAMRTQPVVFASR